MDEEKAIGSAHDALIARVLCAVTGILLPVSLGFTWTKPYYADGDRYSGWALLFSGFGLDTAPHGCNWRDCSGEMFVAGTLPTLAVLLLAAALLVQLRGPSTRWASVATALAVVVLLGLLGELVTIRHGTHVHHVFGKSQLGAGMMVTLWLALVAVAATELVRAAARERSPVP